MSNKNRNSRSGCIVGLLFFMVFVFFFILEVPFSLFQFTWFFPVIFIFIVIIAAAGASSGKPKCCKPEQKIYDHYLQQQVPRVNPYIVRRSVTNDVQTLLVEDYKPKEPTKLEALFCQFCGIRIDKDARFCHQCGSKLE
ncbi:MAG: zinc-ribbon domain-containing protein [Promethearchaeota archaeon]